MFRSRFIFSRLTLDNQDIQPIYYRKITVIENKQKCLFQAKNYNFVVLLTIFESFQSLNFRAKTIQNCKINLPNETFFAIF